MTAAPTVRAPQPLHVGVIMDGNGRWATARGLPRIEGHRHGASVVRRIVEASPQLRIGVLTLFAFSADNWRRPRVEIETLMRIFDEYVRDQARTCLDHGVRFALIGRRDRLLPSLRRHAEGLERSTVGGDALHLRLAIDYSARDAIWLAAERMLKTGCGTRDEFVRRVHSGRGEPDEVPDVDLLIRTGGEQRLSDFLLWESAYAELWFTDTAWPDFTPDEFAEAVKEFCDRDRRFGGLSTAGCRASAQSA